MKELAEEAKIHGYAFVYVEMKNAPEGASLLGTWRKRRDSNPR